MTTEADITETAAPEWVEDACGNRCSDRSTAALLRRLSATETDECIIWIGYLDPNGYGRAWVHGRWSLAHRASYEMNIGTAVDLVVRHACDNPSCINPSNLLVGTQADNSRDCVSRKRRAAGERNGRAKLSASVVASIRSDKRSTRVIGAQYGVSSSRISDIKNNRTWREVATKEN